MCLFFFVALFLQLQRRHMKRCKEKDAFSLQANFFQTHINAHTKKRKERKNENISTLQHFSQQLNFITFASAKLSTHIHTTQHTSQTEKLSRILFFSPTHAPTNTKQDLVLLLQTSPLRRAVREDTSECNSCTSQVKRVNRRTEEHDARHNHDDTLQAVAHGVRDGSDAAQHHERQLLVSMKAHRRDHRFLHDGWRRTADTLECRGGCPRREAHTLGEQRHGQAQECRVDGDDAKQVDGVDALQLLAHNLFG
mmetsp:Transcript_230/g.658  ORF Transcript_230/g.658 Transcript_230/m.658 type:complete len:252 (-) Transcript_230:992-1747(-)